MYEKYEPMVVEKNYQQNVFEIFLYLIYMYKMI